MARRRPDRIALLARLEPVTYEPPDDQPFAGTGIAGVLPALVDISHESEYELCKQVATRLLGELPELPEIWESENDEASPDGDHRDDDRDGVS